MTRLLSLALLLPTLTACSGGTSPDGASPGGSGETVAAVSYTPPGPGECQMVSNADASAALGTSITFNQNEYSPDTCNIVPEATTYGIGTIMRMSGFELDQQLEQQYGSSSVTPVEVEGLGDGAAWAVDGVNGRLLFQKGDKLFDVQLAWNNAGAEPDPAVHRARAEALARAILSNA